MYKTVLSLTYLGNIQWVGKLCAGGCVIDLGGHYVKQSYRNRCEILAPGGRTALTVNTVKGNKQPMKDVRIDYSKRWQHQHRQAIVSAYANAPYFDHYWPELEPFFTRNHEFLRDLDAGLLENILRMLGSDVSPVYSETYVEPAPGFADLRDAISPKPRLSRPDPLFRPERYWQVFCDKLPFEPNLSVIDLLFCEGPHALSVLRRSTLAER